MPTYEYRCEDCNHQFERFQKMSDDPVTECETCGGKVQRVLFPVAVHFKGSGFYTTDYARKKTLAASSNGNGNGTGTGGTSSTADAGESSSAAKKEEKVTTPAASKD